MPDNNDHKKSTIDLVASSNLVALETMIIGDINTQGNIRIEGKVEGSLISKSKIVIGDSAYVTGNIHALEAEVSGRIDGEIHCKGTLFLKKTAYVQGNILAAKLIIENGAVFNGKCNMSGAVDPLNPHINNNGEPEKKTRSK